MKRAVLDAGALLAWFEPGGDRHPRRAEYEAGQLAVVAPRSIVGDAIARLAGRPGWTADRVERAAVELGRLGLELHEPPVAELARSVARGLSPDRAAYAAVASALDLPLETDDPELRRVAGRSVDA